MSDALHSDWSPSSMGRILSCPASVELNKLYPNESNDAANLGTLAHGILEDCLVFGTAPEHDDLELIDGVQLALDYAGQLEKDGFDLHIEKRLSIPDTPIWGTTDIVGERHNKLVIADFKYGYLPVDVKLNAQMMTYLVAAIAEFGERKSYEIVIIQPRYHHIEGPVRSYTVTTDDLEWFQGEIKFALENSDLFKAGKHCKYCRAQGGCKAFTDYAYSIAGKALYYDLTDRHAVTDETLSALLEFSELLPGWKDAIRKEAFKRALADREITGHKIVPGAVKRAWDFSAPEILAEFYAEIGIPEEAIWEQSLISPATAEKHIKATFRGKKNYEPILKRLNNLIKETKGGLVIVKDQDGRATYKKGMEFDELPDTNDIEL